MTTNLRQLFLEHVGQTSDNPMMLEVERAEGVYLYGPDGRRWIDLISGVSVSAVGHGNRRVIDAICAQARLPSSDGLWRGGRVAAGALCRADRFAAARSARHGLLRQFGQRGRRRGAQTGQALYRPYRAGLLPECLSRQYGRFAERHGRRRVPQFLSSAAARHALHSLQRARRPEIHYLADGLRNHRARSGRGGDRPFGKGLSGSVAPPLRRDRRAARFRRDTDRAGPDRHALFFSAVRRRARYTMYGQGVRRRHAARSLHRSEPDHVVAEDQSGARAHHDFRRSSGLLRRRLGGPRVHPVGGAHGAGRRKGGAVRASSGRASGRA